MFHPQVIVKKFITLQIVMIVIMSLTQDFVQNVIDAINVRTVQDALGISVKEWKIVDIQNGQGIGLNQLVLIQKHGLAQIHCL